jgi:hypothetical protein
VDELMGRIRTETWTTLAHITGPSAVLVSLQFGITPEAGPLVIKSLGADKLDGAIKFDLERYVAEVVSGVDEANAKHNGSLQVAAMRIVPDDYPSQGQVKYVAYLIARYAITGETWG